MPKVNGTKYSKSGLIHRLLDPRTRATTLPAVLKSNGVRLPKTVLFGEGYDPELCKSDILTNKYRGFYSYFSLKKSPKIEGDSSDLVRKLMQETSKRLFRLLKSPDFPEIPTALTMKSDVETIFYFSLLTIQGQCHKTEHSLLSLLYRLFEGSSSRGFLKYCKAKFSKKTIGEFIQGNICDLKRCYAFLSSIAHKLPENIVELWFEHNLDACDGIFARLNSIRLAESTRFNRFVFEDLIKFKNFRKAVFNRLLNDEFVVSMKEFANRPDFDYFYRIKGIKRRLNNLPIRPKDAVEYDFFDSMANKRLMHSNIIKIRNYQVKHGHTPTLNSFVSENLLGILRCIEPEGRAEDIIVDTIKYNNSPESHIATPMNDVIFEELRKKEDIFRRVAKYFKNPKDRVLFNLVTGKFDFRIEDAKSYINLGYEEELVDYFETQSISDSISIADSWNREFLVKTFIGKAPYSLSDAKLLLEFVGPKNNLELVSEVLDHVLDVDSGELFENLPEKLRIIYVLRHRAYIPEFIISIEPESCTLEQASWVFEVLSLEGPQSLDRPSSTSITNPYYNCAVRNDFEFDESCLAKSLFECCYIRRGESKYVFVEYFDRFIEEVAKKYSKDEIVACASRNYNFDGWFCSQTHGKDRIQHSLGHSFDFNELSQISFVLELGFRNKYSTYILFDRLMSILSEGSSIHRILILNFVNPSVLCKAHILRYINTVVPLLTSSNSTVCRLSKASLNLIKVETREVQNILPEIIQSITSREYFPTFLASFRSILFNNYLCFNSLSIIVQLMFKYLDDYTKDTLFILGKIANIVKDKDMKHISGLIFSNIGKFVVSHNFYTREALEVSAQFCLYVKFSDFDVLLQNLASMRICSYLVGILKIKSDAELNNQIISHVVHNRGKDSPVEPAFIAAASELEEFTQCLDQFLPILKTLFRDSKAETRNIAGKAFKHILERPNVEDHAAQINSFLIECSINEDYSIRLLCLDVLDYLPIIYILRSDQHSLVRKKAQDIWKDRVSNTNKVLKSLYGDILDLIEFSENKAFCFALRGAVSDMAVKYTPYLELYIRSNDKRSEINEFILIGALKANKMVDTASEFCKKHFSVGIFHLLYRMPGYRDQVIDSFEVENLLEACRDDNELALGLYSSSKNPVYLDFLSTAQKLEIIRDHCHSSGSVSESDEHMICVLQNVESCPEAESILVRIHPTYSYYYLSAARADHGSLGRIFERVFESCYSIDALVSERNIRYIRGCPVNRVENKTYLLSLFLKHEDKKSFEKVVQLVKESDFKEDLEREFVFEIMGYLLRNYLSVNRRADTYDCIAIMYEHYKESMGFFTQIAKTSILNH